MIHIVSVVRWRLSDIVHVPVHSLALAAQMTLGEERVIDLEVVVSGTGARGLSKKVVNKRKI